MTQMENPCDEVWTVVKPRNGSAQAVDEMNAKMMAWHPALDGVRREDHSVMQDAHDVLQEDLSVAELFRNAKHL